MPILKCDIVTGSKPLSVKMLIDSGSSLDLISGALAAKLKKQGCATMPMKKGIKIKVANGKRSVLQEALHLQLQLGTETTEAIDFLVLRDLPFDMGWCGRNCCRGC